MGEVVRTVTRTIPCSLDDVWAAMHRTADLAITDGWQTIERISDSAWVGELQGKKATCETSFDAATRSAQVTMHNSMKRNTVDTTLLQAKPADGGTEVTVVTTIRGGAVTMFMMRLTGEGALDKLGQNIISNIEALCTGGDARGLSPDELDAYAHTRLDEIDHELNG
jgi:hypothetical protein